MYFKNSNYNDFYWFKFIITIQIFANLNFTRLKNSNFNCLKIFKSITVFPNLNFNRLKNSNFTVFVNSFPISFIVSTRSEPYTKFILKFSQKIPTPFRNPTSFKRCQIHFIFAQNKHTFKEKKAQICWKCSKFKAGGSRKKRKRSVFIWNP